MNSLLNQAQNTENLEDQTQVSEGGQFDNEPPAAGITTCRFIGYVEVGKRKQKPFQGKDKPDAEEVRLYFELNSPKHVREVEIDGQPRKFANVVSIKMAKKLNDRAKFTKLFRKMTYGRDSITHMAHMLGEGFLVTVRHNVVKGEGGNKDRTYANLDADDGSYTFQAPQVTDPMTDETKPVPVPEAITPFKLLLWDSPTQEQWDSIFIDGTRTVKDAKGVETEVSKNWLQEDILKNAVNFPGSPLEQLVGGMAGLDLEPEDDLVEAPEDTSPPKDDAPETKKETSTPPQDPAPDALDILSQLGIS